MRKATGHEVSPLSIFPSFSSSLFVSILKWWLVLKFFTRQCFWLNYSLGRIFLLFFLWAQSYAPSINWIMASLWFQCSNFSFPWPNVLKCLYNVFDHNTQVKFKFGLLLLFIVIRKRYLPSFQPNDFKLKHCCYGHVDMCMW